MVFWLERSWAPPPWLGFAIRLPVLTLVSMLLLPRMKGVVIGSSWAMGVTRASVARN